VEPGAVEAVETEVYRFEAQPSQLRYVRGCQYAVGGHMQLREAGYVGEPPHKVHQTRPHEGFAAREPHLRYPHPGQHRYHALHLLVGQQLLFGQILDTRFGHTVKAPQVAAVGYGQPEVVDRAVVIIEEHAW
jgi:hypothetical protein